MGENLKNLSDLLDKANLVVMVVAHPDDEVFSFANLLLLYGKKIQIICVTDANYENNGASRIKKMDNIAKEITGRKVINLNFPDNPGIDLNIFDISNKLMALGLNEADLIFTHSPHGDYGHLNHRDCFFATIQAFPEKQVLFRADYVEPDFEVKIPLEMFEEKQRLILEKYFDEFREFWKFGKISIYEHYASCSAVECQELRNFLVEGDKPNVDKLQKYKNFWRILAPRRFLP